LAVFDERNKMDNFESVNDILDFAIAEEIAVCHFYTQMAEKAKNPDIKKVFEGLVQEEKGHREKLKNIKANNETFGAEKVVDLSIADFLVPVEPTADMDYQTAITLAMKKEGSAMKLYKLLAAMADKKDLKKIFLALSQEEAKHKLRFEKEYEDEILKED
jgi:rubrerythrin